MTRPARFFFLVTVATASVALAGCTSPQLSQLPASIYVSVQQNRSDSADRRVQLRITNDSNAALTVESLKFSSPVYSPAVEYAKLPSTVRAHSILDLPVALPAPRCASTDTTPTVSIDFTSGNLSGHATLTPNDPIHQLPGIRSLDCLNETMANIATLTMPDALRTETLSGKLVAMIDVAVAPTGTDESFTITAVERTILIAPVRVPDAEPVGSLPLNFVVNGRGVPSTLTIPILPFRCDDHALADDKHGTLLPLRISLGDTQGISYLGVTSRLKSEIFAYLQSSCTYR